MQKLAQQVVLKIYTVMYGEGTSLIDVSDIWVIRLVFEVQVNMCGILVLFWILVKDVWFIFLVAQKRMPDVKKNAKSICFQQLICRAETRDHGVSNQNVKLVDL